VLDDVVFGRVDVALGVLRDADGTRVAERVPSTVLLAVVLVEVESVKVGVWLGIGDGDGVTDCCESECDAVLDDVVFGRVDVALGVLRDADGTRVAERVPSTVLLAVVLVEVERVAVRAADGVLHTSRLQKVGEGDSSSLDE
jgi:hypothetical protein